MIEVTKEVIEGVTDLFHAGKLNPNLYGEVLRKENEILYNFFSTQINGMIDYGLADQIKGYAAGFYTVYAILKNQIESDELREILK